MIKEPLRGYWKLPIDTKYGLVVLSFQQASAKDTEEYYSIIERLQNDALYIHEYNTYRSDFYDRCASISSKWYTINALKRAKKIFMVRMQPSNNFSSNLYENIVNRLHKSHTSIYTKEIKNPKGKKQLLQRTDKNLSEYTGVAMDKVKECFTQEQIGYFFDCMNWDYYDTFPAGEQENKRILFSMDKGLSESQKTLLEELRANSTINYNK